jgi:ferredoxin
MDIHSAKLIFFSPTQTAKKVLEGIARGLQVDTVERLDLTPPGARTGEFEAMHDELAVVGAPVYGGRIPLEAVHRLQRLEANDTPAVVVVVYGNREYEDALLELRDLAVGAGFKPLAGGAFIGEHSFHTDTTPIAGGRPDAEDLEKAAKFGEAIRKKMRDIRALDEVAPIKVPGNVPYKKRGDPLGISPLTREARCAKCKECAASCPVAAIAVRDTVMTDRKACILCTACVKNCPSGARVWEDPWVIEAAGWLSTNYGRRKEPEMYM